MTKVLVHEMKYCGENVDSDMHLVKYSSEYYEQYKRVSCDSFRELSLATHIDPDAFYTREEMAQKNEVFMLLSEDSEIIGAVDIDKNNIDHLFVNVKYQNQGYGKKLLTFAVSLILKAGLKDITLCVADLNKKAIQLYLNNGFKTVGSVIDNW